MERGRERGREKGRERKWSQGGRHQRQGSQTHDKRQVDPALVFLAVVDVGWLLVEPDSEALQFPFDDLLVLQRLQDVQDDEDQPAGPRHRYHLATTPLPVFRTLDDPGEIQQLCAELKIAAGHWPFSMQFSTMATTQKFDHVCIKLYKWPIKISAKRKALLFLALCVCTRVSSSSVSSSLHQYTTQQLAGSQWPKAGPS